MKATLIAAGVVIGLGIGAGAIVNAASGDLVYEQHESAAITGPQAANLADAFIAVGAWSGARSDMIRCKVERHSNGTTNFTATCVGTKSVPAASVPFPVVVTGVEP